MSTTSLLFNVLVPAAVGMFAGNRYWQYKREEFNQKKCDALNHLNTQADSIKKSEFPLKNSSLKTVEHLKSVIETGGLTQNNTTVAAAAFFNDANFQLTQFLLRDMKLKPSPADSKILQEFFSQEEREKISQVKARK